MYKFKQDLAMAYFPHCSNVAQSECRGGLPTLPNQSNVIEDKKTASRLLARESTILKSESKVNSFTLPSRRFVCHANLTLELLDVLRPTGSAPLRNASPHACQIPFQHPSYPFMYFLFTFYFVFIYFLLCLCYLNKM